MITISDRVCVMLEVSQRGKDCYVVRLDGKAVLFCGGSSKWDLCEASSYARGIAAGIKVANGT